MTGAVPSESPVPDPEPLPADGAASEDPVGTIPELGAHGHSIRIVAGVVGVVIAAFVILLATRDVQRNEANFDIVGQASPPVTGTGFDGRAFDLDAVLAANRALEPADRTWTVLNFFASWCVGCEQEHQDLVRLEAEGITRGDGTSCAIDMVGVTFNDSATNVEEWFTDRGGSWPVLVGDTQDIVVDYGVTSAPETVIIEPGGRVWNKIIGATTYDQLVSLIPC